MTEIVCFDLIDDATSKGATLEYGGKIPEGFPEQGNWIEPSVVSGVTQEMKLFKDETFGPVAAIMPFESDDEVLALANDTDYGLASYIFTNDHKRIERFTEALEFGEIQINGVKIRYLFASWRYQKQWNWTRLFTFSFGRLSGKENAYQLRFKIKTSE